MINAGCRGVSFLAPTNVLNPEKAIFKVFLGSV